MKLSELIDELLQVKGELAKRREADGALEERVGRMVAALQEQPQNGKPEEFKAEPLSRFRTTPLSDIRDPLAKSLGDMVTPKQLGMIRALAREAKLDPDSECETQLRCRTEELSKRAASSFIDHLKGCVEEFKQPRRAS